MPYLFDTGRFYECNASETHTDHKKDKKKTKMRTLRKDEIEVRVASTQNNVAQLLLYKTARTDAAILDETFGQFNWQCSYSEIKGNLFCTISVRDPNTNEWISKSDCGSESNIEKEKGEASDAFKRSGFRWGIGVELYSTPKIKIPIEESDMYNGRFCQSFSLKDIQISPDHKITSLTIQDRRGNVRYTYNAQQPQQHQQQHQQQYQQPTPIQENAQGFDFDFSQPIRVAATAQKRKTRYTNDEFISRLSEEKQKYLNDPNKLNKLKRFYEWWMAADTKCPNKTRVEAMNYFDFETRLDKWMND